MEGKFAVSTSKSKVFKDGRIEASVDELDNQKAVLSTKKGYYLLHGDPSNADPKLIVLSNPKYSAVLNRNNPNASWAVAEFSTGGYEECFPKMQGLQQSLIYMRPAEYLIFMPLAPIGKLRDFQDFKIASISRSGSEELRRAHKF